MRIKILAPCGDYRLHDVVDVDDYRGENLVKKGYGKRVGSNVPLTEKKEPAAPAASSGAKG